MQNEIDTPQNMNQEVQEIESLSFSEKFFGLFTSPTKTFEQVAKLPPDFKDWLIPLLTLIAIAMVSTILLIGTPEIKEQMIEQQLDNTEKTLAEAVDAGDMTADEAEKRYSDTEDRIRTQFQDGAITISLFSVAITNIVMLLLVSSIFYFLARFVLRGDGDFSSSLVAYGFPQFIIAIQSLIILAISLGQQKLILSINPAVFLDENTKELTGYLLSKLDPFRIWFYYAIGITYAKMFQSDSTKKYIIAIFSVWIGSSALMFILSELVPFMKFMLF